MLAPRTFRRPGLLKSPVRAAKALMTRQLMTRASEIVGEDIEARLARVPTYYNEVGKDPFGWDANVARHALAIAAIAHRKYFRTEVHGIDQVPNGRCLFVANHSGQLPIDGGIISTSLVFDREPPVFARCLVEKWMAELPYVSTFLPKAGQVIGTPENARRLLEQGQSLIVFPEGARGVGKPFKDRYRLVDFGLGFLRIALETDTPIVPVAVLGAEEQYPAIANIEPLAALFGMPSFPIIPQFFVGLLAPLPTKYRLYFGAPFHFKGDPDARDSLIERKVWLVRETIQTMVKRGLAERRGVFV